MRKFSIIALLFTALPTLACEPGSTVTRVLVPRVQEIPNWVAPARVLPPMPIAPTNFLQVSSTPNWEGSPVIPSPAANVRPTRFVDSTNDKLDRILQRLEKLDDLDRRVTALERK